MKRIFWVVLAVCFAFSVEAFAVEFSADMKTVAAGMTTSSKIYYKNFKTFRTEMAGMVVIAKQPQSYQIFNNTKKYVIIDAQEMEQQNPMSNADDFNEFVKNNQFKKTGTESVGDYKCDVYEGSYKYAEDKPALSMKLWYSPKLDYQVKSEIQLPAPMTGNAVSTLENIKIGPQPDSLFEVPAGFTEAKSVEEAMGMGSFQSGSQMPSGDNSSQMPSQEDIQKMMKKMQEMTGKSQNQ